MAVSESAMIFMSIDSPEKRSASPLTPSPSRGIKGIRLFQAISKRLARRSREDLAEDDSGSSSTDSCSSTSVSRCSRPRKSKNHHHTSSGDSGFKSSSPHHLSNSSVSDTGSSSIQIRQRHRHSTSADSIRKVFQNLTIGSRSKSCVNNNKKEKKSKKNPPKRILRPPVRYIYMKGWSGLPTQRIPITISRSYVNNPCDYGMQYVTGLNR